MRKIVDVVNLNADASCLSSTSWQSVLQGGKHSTLYTFLQTYVQLRKKISLGVLGATVVDMAKWNPEAVGLIKDHPEVFEIILRPFAHDISLLRSPEGFALNFRYGKEVLLKEFGRVESYFLPPEFMLTNYQVAQLVAEGVQGTFVNANRFTSDVKKKIPTLPYMVRGVNETSLVCIPVSGDLTKAYLDSIHRYDAGAWNAKILELPNEINVSWRDGESPFLIPDGNERERGWLESESSEIERMFVAEARKQWTPQPPAGAGGDRLLSYPVHSFLAWVKEFRMLGFVQKVNAYEERLSTLSTPEKTIWFSLINSDILSAVEKASPVVSLLDRTAKREYSFTIWRSERGFEGEEYLYVLDNLRKKPELLRGGQFHIQRLANRSAYLTMLMDKPNGDR